MKKFNKRVWLNSTKSASTGNIVAYCGPSTYGNAKTRRENPSIFLSVSDCHNAARLHKTDQDSMQDFINKLKKMNNTISEFITHLEKEI